METTNTADEQRPSKRIRVPLQRYVAGPASGRLSSVQEERMLAQALANSRKEKSREPLTNIPIPFGPTFYPTVEEFSGDPLVYLETIRPEAEKYGEFISSFFINVNSFNMRDTTSPFPPHT